MTETPQICTRCLMPDTYPGISFNDVGLCNLCQEYRKVEPIGEEALAAKLNSKSGGEYDCVVGISGGKDSCYVAYLAKEKLKLRTLAVCYDFPFLVDLAKENIERVCNSLNLEVMYIRGKRNVEHRFLRNHLISLAGTATTWGQCIFCHYGIDGVLFDVAKKKNIPHILIGTTRNELWNPGSRTEFLLKRIKQLPARKLLSFVYFQLKAYFNLVDQRRQFMIPGNSCLDVYSRAHLPGSGPEIVYVYDYVKWDQKVIEKTLRERTGWQKPEKATSWRYDCMLEPLLDFTYKKEFGISTVGIYLSGLIREGLIERDSALRIQERSEVDEELRNSLKAALDFLKIPERTQKKFFAQ